MLKLVFSVLAVCLLSSCLANPVTSDPCEGNDAPINTTYELPTDVFKHNVTLDDNYTLFCDFNDTHIIFKAQVATTGYVGLGVAQDASMYPSDLVIGWVDSDGHAHMKDRHSVQYGVPPVDTHQDWTLVSGTQDNGLTSIVLIRPLNTCDDQDIPITAGANWVIWSYHPVDPTSDLDINYREETKGVSSVVFF